MNELPEMSIKKYIRKYQKNVSKLQQIRSYLLQLKK
jgi:hypothetical protein